MFEGYFPPVKSYIAMSSVLQIVERKIIVKVSKI